MATNIIKGGCLCGNIRFEAVGKPIWIGYCHCEKCRRATGAPAVTHVGFSESDLTFIKGKQKLFESSPGVRRGFCADCGTPLTYDGDRFPSYIQVYLGTLDEPDQLLPQAHVHTSEKISWYEVDDALPRFLGSAAAGSDDWRS